VQNQLKSLDQSPKNVFLSSDYRPQQRELTHATGQRCVT